MISTKPMLFNKIENTITSLNIKSISTERKETLQPLIDFIKTKVNANEEIRINRNNY